MSTVEFGTNTTPPRLTAESLCHEGSTMPRIALRLLVALITFAVGVTAAVVWLLPHRYGHDRFSHSGGAAMSAPQQKLIACQKVEQPLRGTFGSNINEGGKSPWSWQEAKMSGGEDLGVVQFLNANDGWVGGAKAALYKTADAGRTWRKIKLDVPPDSSVSAISFVSPSVGWVIATQNGDVFNDINTVTSRILATTDGGNTWQSQHYKKALRLSRIRFINEQEGWAVGAKIPVSVGYEGVVLHTTDGGKTWADVSPKVGADELGNTSSVVNIIPTAPSKALILKFSRVFHSTEDGGHTWRRVASLPEEPPQALLDEITVTGDNRMWAVGGADSIEGMWGTVARMDSDCSWTKYSVGGVLFLDAAFLSDSEALAVGDIPSPGQGKSFESRGRDGLILYSSDGARNWSVVYRSSKVRVITALSVVDRGNLWAVGADGGIIHLTPVANR